MIHINVKNNKIFAEVLHLEPPTGKLVKTEIEGTVYFLFELFI